MNLKRITVQRFSESSSKPFGEVAIKFEAGIGHPDMNQFWKEITAAQTEAGLEKSSTKLNRPLSRHWVFSSRSDPVPILPRNADARQPPAGGIPEYRFRAK